MKFGFRTGGFRNWKIEDILKELGIKKPKIYIAADSSPNAFAFGRTKNNANLALHSGLFGLLNRDEIKKNKKTRIHGYMSSLLKE